MRKKELAALPVMKTRKKGKVLCVRINGDAMVLDCYNEGEYVGRYCLRECGEYMALTEGTWKQWKLEDMITGRRYSYWRSYTGKIVCDTKEQEAFAMAFLDKADVVGYTSLDSRIDAAERGFMLAKRERAWKKKLDRIEARMAKVPSLPDGFETWCKEVPFGGQQYLFKTDKPDVYACTACGGTHRAKAAKNNRPWICRRTGRTVTVSKSPESRWKKERAMVLQWMTTGERVARHFIVHSWWDKKGQYIMAAEEVRYILRPDGCNEWYYGQYGEADEYSQDWWTSNPRGKHTEREYCYPEGVGEILANTVWERLGIPEMASMGWRVWYNKLMIYHDQCRSYEYLTKGGYRHLVEDASSWPTVNINSCGTTLEKVLGVDKQRALRLRRLDGDLNCLRWLQWEQKHKVKIPDKELRWLMDNKVHHDDVEPALQANMSPAQVAHYLERQMSQSKKRAGWLSVEWKDTLHMARQLGLDTKDDIVRRPRDLIAFHDRLVAMMNQRAAEEQAKEYEKRFPGIGKVCESLQRYEWSDGVYMVRAPQGIADVLAEGRSLNHCVTNERYFERMAREQSFILFLRKADQPDVPWYTLEVEPGGTIRQKRTHWNRQEKDLEDAKDFLRRWQQEIVKRVGARERDLQARSKVEREKELEQLRRDGVIVHGGEMSGILLADVLLADLMEVAG